MDELLAIPYIDKVFDNEQDMVSFAKNFSNNLKPCAPNAVAITKSIFSDLDNSSDFSIGLRFWSYFKLLNL